MEIRYRRGAKRPWKNEDLAKDYNKGMKIKDIKAKYNISKQGIYYILSKLANKQATA